MPGPMQLNHEHTESYGTGGGGGTPDPHTHTESDILDLGDYIEHATSDGNEYVSKNGAWAVASGGGGGSGLFDALVVLRDEKSTGTGGGSITSDTWTTRDLNTEAADTASICTLSSNQFSLPAGTYWLTGFAPFYRADTVKLRIRDITNTATLLIGGPGLSNDSDNSAISCPIAGMFTLSGTTTLELQCKVDNAQGGTSTLGNTFSSDSSEANVFSVLNILRLA